MPTERGHLPPLTLAACHPGWDDYFDINKTVTKMANRLMEEDRQRVEMPPKVGTTPKQKDVTQITVLPPNDDTTLVSATEFLGGQTPEQCHRCVGLGFVPYEGCRDGG